MFLGHFDLREQPFGATPDTRFLYLSPTHREALASLYYGIESERGFLALIAEPGMGKTTICRQLEQRVDPSIQTAFIFQTTLSSTNLLRAIVMDLGGEVANCGPAVIVEALNGIIAERASHRGGVILFVDEAQNLSEEALEQLRLLSNFETQRRKLLQIVLAGQLGLADLLGRRSLVQLRQRVGTIGKIERFSAEESCKYIRHRLRMAGRDDDALFSKDAMELIAEHSRGIPRNINTVCFNALSLAFAEKSKRVETTFVEEVMADLNLAEFASERPRQGKTSAVVAQVESWVVSIERHPARKVLTCAIYTALAAIGLLMGVLVQMHPRPKWADMRAEQALRPALPEQRLDADKRPTVQEVSAASILDAPTMPTDTARLVPVLSYDPAAAMGQQGGPRIHMVQRNETIMKIARSEYPRASPKLVQQIVAMNPEITDPNHITPGQCLKLPRITAK